MYATLRTDVPCQKVLLRFLVRHQSRLREQPVQERRHRKVVFLDAAFLCVVLISGRSKIVVSQREKAQLCNNRQWVWTAYRTHIQPWCVHVALSTSIYRMLLGHPSHRCDGTLILVLLEERPGLICKSLLYWPRPSWASSDIVGGVSVCLGRARAAGRQERKDRAVHQLQDADHNGGPPDHHWHLYGSCYCYLTIHFCHLSLFLLGP
jgi:hypothetical protein